MCVLKPDNPISRHRKKTGRALVTYTYIIPNLSLSVCVSLLKHHGRPRFPRERFLLQHVATVLDPVVVARVRPHLLEKR